MTRRGKRGVGRRTAARPRRSVGPRRGSRAAPGLLAARFRLPAPALAVQALLHAAPASERPWTLLPLILLLAFAVRAAIALDGDFVLHPDEIMQYLEPAHRLVFGNGVVHWEYHYGARSWLVPGLVAGLLLVFDSVGLGEPSWYVDGVKLAFCAVSLLIPAGMYFFARVHFDELAARIALVAGAFWYELVGFAHKPMTEFVATAPLLVLLALCVRPAAPGAVTAWCTGLAAVLVAAVRPQYAPLALLLLAVALARGGARLHVVLAALVCALAVGVLDAGAWDAGLFHSYLVNLRFNLILGELRAGESPVWQYLSWLFVASGGVGALCFACALLRPGRYAFLLMLIAMVVALHSLQAHKEYRFVFAVAPLWLLAGADLAARAVRAGGARSVLAGIGLLGGAAACAAGIFDALPGQDRLYRAWSRETGVVSFLGARDPVFAAYRYLAEAPGVTGVLQPDRPYHALPGYYYLHRPIPFYDGMTVGLLEEEGVPLVEAVSHVVTADPGLTLAGYGPDRAFGPVRILRRERSEGHLRRWEEYAPTVIDGFTVRIMRRVVPDASDPPPRRNVRFSP